PHVDRTLRLLDQLFRRENCRDVSVELWDGTRWPPESEMGPGPISEARPVTLVLRHPGALRAACLPGTELGLAEAYLYDDMDIVGNIEAMFGLADAVTQAAPGWRQAIAIGRELRRLPAGTGRPRGARRGPARLAGRRHSIERDRRAVRYHYDVSNDFYALWLDPRMVYSCAYFRSPSDDLAAAQEHKLEHVCRKLRLRPGRRLLDIGCGWGGLVMYAAERFGVDATGISLSEPQVELANRRIASAGLEGRCRAEVRDYREAPAGGDGGYDALVSVGMSEHVGLDTLPVYFRRAFDLLKPGGVFLNHAISDHPTRPKPPRNSFSDVYVFPDGETPPVSAVLEAAEGAGFEVRDVENLREHYTATLRHWMRRLEARHEEALRFVDEATYRVWRLFMAGSAHRFATGTLGVYQALVVKPGPDGRSALPATRADWYQ
ncbi:MAG: putative cyclopropane-fatty-acyl-phospholipid synthase, partial [Acidobacteria bacterium]|nr:putative cyclopropane-fatty-acyl-phospholipid synthase [Acidobacteriota bacterium]